MRKSYKGELCTVKYTGPITAWTEPAYGVEWDNPARGKHSGILGGHQYFTCSVENAGSFLKVSKISDRSFSFTEALQDKYAKKFEYNEVTLSSAKTVESVGMDKYFERQRQIENLTTISLSGCCVDKFDTSRIPSLVSLKQLDLSHNLFEDLGEALEYIAHFQIEKLDLSYNRFNIFNIKVSIPSVIELNLGSTLLNSQQLKSVLSAFPNLQRLGLSRNRYNEYPLTESIEWIDLAYNQLTSIPDTGLQLILNNNSISGLDHKVEYKSLNLMDQDTPAGMSLLEIDNLIAQELWLTEATYNRVGIIGRLPNLRKLNGTEISVDERRDCEMYVLANDASLPPERKLYLQSVYGENKPPPSNSIAARLVEVFINDIAYQIVGDATIQRLLVLVSRVVQKRAISLSLKLDGRLLGGGEIVRDILSGGESIELVETPDFLRDLLAM